MFPVVKSQDPAILDGMAWYLNSQKLRDAFTKKSKYGDEVKGYVTWGDWIGIPRGCCGSIGSATLDKRTNGLPIEVNCNVPPRNAPQSDLIKDAWARIQDRESFIIQATTGFGKTYCAANLISKHKRTTLVIVTKEDLMGQWRDALKKFLGFTDDDIGYAQQDVCQYHGKKVVLGMVHSIAKDKYPAQFKEHFGMVIFDEVHRMAADTFSIAAGLFPAMIRIGLSATPTRSDGKEFLFMGHIGAVEITTHLMKLPPKVIWQRSPWRASPYLKSHPPEPGKLMHVYKALGQCGTRNDLIANFVFTAWKKGRNVMVFSDLIENHLEPLFWRTHAAGVPEKDMCYYIGGQKEAEREKNKKEKQIFFATYQMTAEATDIPKLDTAVFATPRANIIQPAGRVLREFPDKKQPVIYDIVDHDLPIFEGYMSKRRTQYYGMGATFVKVGYV